MWDNRLFGNAAVFFDVVLLSGSRWDWMLTTSGTHIYLDTKHTKSASSIEPGSTKHQNQTRLTYSRIALPNCSRAGTML